MDLFFKYFWFLALFIGPLNYLMVRTRVQRIIKQRPELELDADKVLFGYLIFNTAPYVLLGLIQLTGGFDSPLFLYFAPLSNPFVFASVGVLFVWWGTTAYWIYFNNGAHTLINYQLSSGWNSETLIKITWGLALLGGLFALFVGRFMFSSLLQ